MGDLAISSQKQQGLYLVHISVHGLIRGHNLELGRDADTGGQTKYVVELARALSMDEGVDRVDLLTRCVVDPKVDDDYAQELEAIAPHANIVRLPFGPRRYLRKEALWPYLNSMADQALKHIRHVGRVPDIIHSHYADAGYVGTRLACLLGVPHIHTGHSLGREKRRRLLDQGAKAHSIDKQYHFGLRIEAEEQAMDSASLIIASTSQEVEHQYSLYDNYHPKRMKVIPPGTDLSRFHPPKGLLNNPAILHELQRFLRNPRKPIILALSRADARKNIQTLIRAYGENTQLQELANLVIVAGNRDNIKQMDKDSSKLLQDILLLIDEYDLYGHIAYPKKHHPNDVPEFYRLAAKSRGVFVNPALTEPFGLTLIEAAASGLPTVATEDGGPRDILINCRNGLLIDPLDPDLMGEVLIDALSDKRRWRNWANNGLRGAQRHYAWPGHVQHYLKEARQLLGKQHPVRTILTSKSRLPTVERLLICDIDNTLLGDSEALKEMLEQLSSHGQHIGLGVATGRNLRSATKVLKENGVPMPDLFITSVGSEIHYGRKLKKDNRWEKHINYRWEPERLRHAMSGVPGLRMQAKVDQGSHKISYYIDSNKAPPIRELKRYLRSHDLHANLIYSHQAYLDLLPLRASKGHAVRYIGAKWGILPEHMLVAGDSGNDTDMLRGDTLGVVVGNHDSELNRLAGEPLIYFAEGGYARGVLEGLQHYSFLGASKRAKKDRT